MAKNQYLLISGIVGFLAVALGAFGAHGLKNIIEASLLETYKTGILYHLIHSAILFALAFNLNSNGFLKKSFWLILSGVVLFSGSLYLYALTQIKILVFITPIGGVTLLAGWLLIIIAGMKKS
ncbi:MAG: DUF423 domain-containing protein [Melioribacteraceae bacterium]|nr:DUF423 domain-containing protein [Melioribacteraceae bacterium]